MIFLLSNFFYFFLMPQFENFQPDVYLRTYRKRVIIYTVCSQLFNTIFIRLDQKKKIEKHKNICNKLPSSQHKWRRYTQLQFRQQQKWLLKRFSWLFFVCFCFMLVGFILKTLIWNRNVTFVYLFTLFYEKCVSFVR